MQQEPTSGTASGAVYVQTNAVPNEVIAFRRAEDGSLDLIGSVATGGDGDGSPHLTSQGSVALTGDGRHLLVTNAASDDLSVFSVDPDGSIELRERVHTGAAPKSVAERGGLVVVLNTGEPSLASFRLNTEGIEAVEGGDQALEASDADPAQVAFSPDGSMVVVTQRGTDSIVTHEVTAEGTFGASRSVPSEGPTPYGFAFTSGGTLVVTEAFGAQKGAAAASSYAIEEGSLVVRTSSVGNGRSEICWAVVTPDDRFAFTTNFADGAVSRYAIGSDGSLALEDATAGIAVEGVPGLRDEELSSEGQLVRRLWQTLNFVADVRSRLGVLAPHLLAVNLRNTEGATLAGFARKWIGQDPVAGAWVDFEDAPKCLEPNIQIRREFMAQDFEEVTGAGANPPQQVRELANDVCSAFGIVDPVLIDE